MLSTIRRGSYLRMALFRRFSRSSEASTSGMSNSTNPTSSLSVDKVQQWAQDVEADPTLSLAGTVARNANISDVLIKRNEKSRFTTEVFNHEVKPQGSPRTNQKQSGRCWLFAATNVLRIPIQRKYNLESFQLSPSYLFFWDKLEKANFFLDQIIDTADESYDSRVVQHLLDAPVNDGGQYGMFANIIEKYGIVPNVLYPDGDNTLRSAQVNSQVTTLLRQYAQELREILSSQGVESARDLQQKQIKQIHQLLVVFLGSPPGPNDEIVWEYKDKDGKFGSITTTPLKFYRDIVDADAGSSISLLHDPRNEYGRPVHIERLGNVVGAPEVVYLNKEIDFLANKAIERIKNNKAVFFGTHTPIYHHNETGIIHTGLWDYAKIGFNPTQNKADRLRYHQSLMTHAMTLTGVHLNESGEPVRWKVENSWGEDRGKKGFYTMSHEFFKEYVYQVVIERSEADKATIAALSKDPIDLPPWDPCGALAN